MTSLCPGDIEFGRLDGLVYHEGGTIVTVTSAPILKRWLFDHRSWWGKGRENVPPILPAAFRSAAFYTQAISTDAAANLHGMVLVKAPPGADLAMVHLNTFAQDFVMDGGPNSLLAVVVRGDRVLIAEQNLYIATVPVPVCQRTMKKIIEHAKLVPDAPETQLMDSSDGRADREYRACFALHLREQPNYTAIAKQAQTLVDLLH